MAPAFRRSTNSNQVQMAAKSDSFCWSCRHDEPSLFCSTCVRSFHNSNMCSRSKDLTAEETKQWQCPECIAIKNDEEQMVVKGITMVRLHNLLKVAFDRLKREECLTKKFMVIDSSHSNQMIVNAIDLKTIEGFIVSKKYGCLEAFFSDIKWIVHNTKVHRSDDRDAVKATKLLLDITKEQLYSIRMCDECYINMKRNCFELPCKKPHLLVWAKQRTYPYWPAKLISVDVANNSIDVRYFGEHYYRAVVTPKDCFIYSRNNPSIHLGEYKKPMENALKEADQHIQQLIEKYGSFNYAEANTLLNANMLERHLYDMIPNAWKQLGKSIVPPPIPKPMPASATTVRRQSTPVQKMTTPYQPSPICSSGRIMTRRMSMLAECSTDVPCTVNNKGITSSRRQSIQFDSIDSMFSPIRNKSTVFKSMVDNNTKGGSEGVYQVGKKRKMSDNQTDVGSDVASENSAETLNQVNDLNFKVPETPRVPKARKLYPNNSFHINPIIIANVQALNEMSASNVSPPSKRNSPMKSQSSPTKSQSSPAKSQNSALLSPTKQVVIDQDSLDDPPKVIENIPDSTGSSRIDDVLSNSKGVHSTEMVALCNAVIENNTRKMTACIRSSLEATIYDFLDITKPTQHMQMLQDQLGELRSDCNLRIDGLNAQNIDLKHELNDLNGKYDTLLLTNNEISKQNAEMSESLSAMESKCTVLTVDLRNSVEKNAKLTSNLTAMTKQNTEWKTKADQLQTENINIGKLLKSSEIKVKQLNGKNQSLIDTAAELNATLKRTKNHNTSLTNQLRDMSNQFALEKSNTFEQCHKMITENKKNQWCSTCSKKGGRYYCSSQCEEYYWTQSRHNR